MLKRIYTHLPKSVKPVAESAYDRIFDSESDSIDDDFVSAVFDSQQMFDEYCEEFDKDVTELQSKRIGEFYDIVPESQATFGGMDINQARALYAMIRAEEPKIVVETGVCNGVSTLVVLMALEKNQDGELFSVDYPTFSDDPAPEFQKEQYPADHTFSAIPKNKEPGWIIPEELRDRWELRIGKSQRKLPSLLNELEEIDIFIHDSDHTFPCMMFEYELAWEYLHSDGILVSDDIYANDAFEKFGNIRASRYGKACLALGYALK